MAQPEAHRVVHEVSTELGEFRAEIYEDDMVLSGRLRAPPDDGSLAYVAAAPADRRASFAGSGLPYASREQAFYGTPNAGTASVAADGAFVLTLKTPGSYYAGLGTVLVRPTVFLAYRAGGRQVTGRVAVANPVAYRFGTYPMQFTNARKSPGFYAAHEVAAPRTQEAILRQSAYPEDNYMPLNFWGTRPPR